MPQRQLGSLLLLLTTIFVRPASALAEDWPQWRGAARNGAWRESGLLAKFSEGGPSVLWRAPLGAGYSGPAVAEGKLFVMDRQKQLDAGGQRLPPVGGAFPGVERVVGLDAKTGESLWTHEYDCPYRVLYPEGPRTTPAVSDGKVYALGTMGDLVCLSAESGKLLWWKRLPAAYDTEPPVWGYASHLLVDGDHVYSLAGGNGSAVVAFHKDTGVEAWRALSAEEIGYSPPLLIERGGRRQLIVWLDASLQALDPSTGQTLWRHAHPADGEPSRPVTTIMGPLVEGNRLLVSEFYLGSLVLELDEAAPHAKVLWRSKDNNPHRPADLNAVMTAPVMKNGHIYGVCADGQLRCVEADSGKVAWETFELLGGRRAPNGTLFLVDCDEPADAGDRFFVFTDQGDLLIAEMTPTGFTELDRAHLLEPTSFSRGRNVVWSHPAFADKCCFARNDKEIICVLLAEQPVEGPG